MTESLIRKLEAENIEIPARVHSALAVRAVAGQERKVADAASLLTSQLYSGTLDAQNFHDRLLSACTEELATAPNSAGRITWVATQAVQHAADNIVTGWLSSAFDDIFDTLGEKFDAAASILTENLPKALPPGSQPEQVLKFGRKGIEAAEVVTQADVELSRLYHLIREVGAAVDIDVPFGRFVDSGSNPLPPESGVWADYVRGGNSVGIVSEQRAAEIAALTAALAHEAEAEQWRPRVREEAQRLAGLRDRGLRPTWVLQVPPTFEYLITEAADELGLRVGVPA
jgi:hypothetical protein